MSRATNRPPSPPPAAPGDGMGELEAMLAGPGTERLAAAVDRIRNAYLGVARTSVQELADELGRLAEMLRDPPEGVDPAQLVLETDRLLGEVEDDLGRTRRSS